MGTLQERLAAAKRKAREADTGSVPVSGTLSLSDRLAAAKKKAAGIDAEKAAPKSASAAEPILRAARLKNGSVWTVTPEEAAAAGKTQKTEPESIESSWDRWTELANRESLTPEEKAEAKTAVSALSDGAYNLRGGFWQNGTVENKRKANEYSALAAMLQNKSSAGSAVAAGAISAVPFAGKVIRKATEAGTNDEILDSLYQDDALKAALKGNNALENAQSASPLGYAAGSIGMSIGMLTGAAGAAKSITSGIAGFSKLSPWIKNAITSAMSFGTVSGLTAAGNTQSKEEWDAAEQEKAELAESIGQTYQPKEYSVLGQVGNVAKQTAIGAAGGAAGGALSTVVSNAALKALFKYQLQNDILPVAIANGLAGAGFAAGNTGVQELAKALEYREDYTPNVREIGTNLLIGFGFGVIQSVIETSKVTASNKKWMQEQYDSLVNGYKKAEFTMAGMSTADRVKAATETLSRIDALRESLNTTQIVGGGKEIRQVRACLDMIEGEMMGIVSTYRQTAVGSGTAPAAAGTVQGGGMPAGAMQVPAAAAETPVPMVPAVAGTTPAPATGAQTAKVSKLKMAEPAAEAGETGGPVLPGGGETDRPVQQDSGYKHTGYILPDGKSIGFDDPYGQHRELFDQMRKDNSLDAGADISQAVDSGIIRVKPDVGIEISLETEPSNKQYEAIRKVINDFAGNTFYLDFSLDGTHAGSLEYSAEAIDPKRILQDIKRHYSGQPIQHTQDTAQTAQELPTKPAGEPANKLIKGGTENGQAGQPLPGGNGGRLSGVGAGGQAGVLAAGTEGAKPGVNQGRTAIERQNRINGLRPEIQRISARELGVTQGTDNKTVALVPEKLYDGELKEVSARLEEDGRDVSFFTGSLQIETGDGVRLVRGVSSNGKMLVQADNARYTATQLADHEHFHALAEDNPGLVTQIEAAVREKYDEREFSSVVEKYIRKYRGIYQTDDPLLYLEELFADAYAGINDFGAGATAYSREARETVRERTGISYGERTPETVRKTAEQAAMTARFSLNPDFSAELDAWDGNPYKTFHLGTTSEPLQNIGVNDRDIVLRGKTVTHILKRHAGMNMEIVKQIPDILEHPVIVLKSKLDFAGNESESSRLAIFGEVYDKSDPAAPVLAVLELRPVTKAGDILDLNLVSSAYGKTKAPADFIGRSDVVYLGEDRKRTDTWLHGLGLQLPSYTTTYGPIGRISYHGSFVKIEGVPYQDLVRRESNEPMLPGGETSETDSDGNELTPTQNPDIRYSAAGTGKEQRRGETYAEKLRKDFGLKMPGGAETEEPEIPEGMTVDEYVQTLEQKSAAAKAERLRLIPKEKFKGTPNLEKLGVKVEGSVADYRFVDSMLAANKAAGSVQRELKNAERRLRPTEAERDFASGIASGIYDEAGIPASMDEDKVMELADYYMAGRALGEDMIRARGRDISRAVDEKIEALFRDSDKYTPSGSFVLNNRTPQRNMLHIFGDDQGAKINAYLIDPVSVNEAERFRFMNRMLDRVRTFKGADGKQSRLTKDERALTKQLMEGRAAADQVAGMEMSGAIRNVAENLKNGKDLDDSVREFSLSFDEKKLAVKYARWLQTKEQLESGNVDAVKINSAAKTFSEQFDLFYAAINDFLTAHGYEPIGFIRGYAPHLQPQGNINLLNKALQSLGINTEVTRLPTSIAGMTADYKPNKRWDPYFLSRTSDVTDDDIYTAYESYVDYMSDVLYHTDDIMRVRRAVNYFRKTYAPEEIRNQIEWAENLRFASTEEKANLLRSAGKLSAASSLSANDISAQMDDYIDELYGDIKKITKYSGFVPYLENYANILAGKQTMEDRGWEYGIGRTGLNIGNKLTRVFARAQIAGNLSTVLNQTAQAPQIMAENGLINTMQAVTDIMRGKLRRAGFAEESDFLTGKMGIDYLVMSPADMVIKAMFTPAEIMDRTIGAIAVRSAYLKAVRAGDDHKTALKKADAYAASVMAARTKGARPLAFEAKNPISQMLHIFQLEALNSWEHLSQDLPRDFREIEDKQGRGKAAWALAGVIGKMLLAAFLLNRLTEEAYGGTPAPFDILGLSSNFIASGEGLSTNEWLRTVMDNGWEHMTGERLFGTEEQDPDRAFDWNAAFEDTAYNVSNDIPFFRNAAGLLGLGDETLPIPLADIGGDIQNVQSAAENSGPYSSEMLAALGGIFAQLLPGGHQARKSFQGTSTILRGGRYYGYGDKERLQYPVEPSVPSALQAALFGNTGLSETEDFYSSGMSGLSVKQTQLYNELVDGGADRFTVYNAIQGLRAIGADDELTSAEQARNKRDLITEAVLTDQEKAGLYSGMISDSRDDEFNAMMDAGMNWANVMKAYNQYADLDGREDLTPTQKATEFAKWTDDQSFTRSQKQIVKNELTFYTTMPAESTRYDKLMDAGLSSGEAYDITEDLSGLDSDAKSAEKYMVIAGQPYEEDVKEMALSTVMSESAYAKYRSVRDAGVSTYDYCEFLQILASVNTNSSVSQDDVYAALSQTNLKKREKTAIWDTYGWKTGYGEYTPKSKLTGLTLPGLK